MSFHDYVTRQIHTNALRYTQGKDTIMSQYIKLQFDNPSLQLCGHNNTHPQTMSSYGVYTDSPQFMFDQQTDSSRPHRTTATCAQTDPRNPLCPQPDIPKFPSIDLQSATRTKKQSNTPDKQPGDLVMYKALQSQSPMLTNVAWIGAQVR
jgi:hypothetical protein